MIRIVEALPNPKNSDTGNEWVKIKNDGSEMNISHWRISDFSSKGKYFNDLKLKTGEEKIIFTDTIGISLNNNGDRLCFNAGSQTENCVEYLTAPKEGEIIYFADSPLFASSGFPMKQKEFPFSHTIAAGAVFGIVATLFLMRICKEPKTEKQNNETGK